MFICKLMADLYFVHLLKLGRYMLLFAYIATSWSENSDSDVKSRREKTVSYYHHQSISADKYKYLGIIIEPEFTFKRKVVNSQIWFGKF